MCVGLVGLGWESRGGEGGENVFARGRGWGCVVAVECFGYGSSGQSAVTPAALWLGWTSWRIIERFLTVRASGEAWVLFTA